MKLLERLKTFSFTGDRLRISRRDYLKAQAFGNVVGAEWRLQREQGTVEPGEMGKFIDRCVDAALRDDADA